MMHPRFWCLITALGLGSLQGCVAPVVAAGSGAGVASSTSPKAGTAPAIVATADRRSAKAMVEDDTIESSAQRRVSEKYQNSARAQIYAYDGYVLITGWAAGDEAKMDIEHIVGSVHNVKGIANEVVVSKMPIDPSPEDDARLAASVKYRFVKAPDLRTDNVKVITLNGVVYLMGMVTHAEADAASEIASTTAGVQRVVRVFEYVK